MLDLFPGTKLGIGPALLDDPRYGFFYDVIAPRALTEADLPLIEKKMRDIAEAQHALPARRNSEGRGAASSFNEREEPLKCELIDEKAGETVSVYYIDGSPFIDFCLGPHVPNTNRLKAFKLLVARWRVLERVTLNGRRCSASTAPPSSLRKSSMPG